MVYCDHPKATAYHTDHQTTQKTHRGNIKVESKTRENFLAQFL